MSHIPYLKDRSIHIFFPTTLIYLDSEKSDQDRAISFSNICGFRLNSSIFNEHNCFVKKLWHEINMTLEFMNRWHTVLDDGYIFKNALEMLNSAFMFDEAIWLVQEPKRIVNRFLKFGLSDILEDIDIAASFVRKTMCWNNRMLHLLEWLRFLKHVVTEVDGAYEKDMFDGLLWTFLYNRLLYYHDILGQIQCFQRKIESQCEKPWIKPQRISHSFSSPSNSNIGGAIFKGTIAIGHTGWVWAMDCSADGRTIVSGSTDRTIRVWVREDGLWTNSALSGHTSTVFSVSINAPGDLINSKDKDGNSFAWKIDNKQWKKAKGHGFKTQFSVSNTSSLSHQNVQFSSFSSAVSKLSGHLTILIPSGFVTAVSHYPYIEFYEFSN